MQHKSHQACQHLNQVNEKNTDRMPVHLYADGLL